MEMPDQEAAAPPGRFSLKDIKKPWNLDPHLQEQILATEAGQTPYPFISSQGGKVDVLARLNDPRKPIPKAFHLSRWIGKEKVSDIITGAVAVGDIENVRGAVASLKAGTEVHFNLHHSVPALQCNPEALDAAARSASGKAYPGVKGTGVIVGIVDYGCDFKHANFCRTAGSTRLLYLWDQSDVTTAGVYAPEPFGYGREFDSAAINRALSSDPYTTLEYTPPLAAHGTHVMDIAAGDGREPNLLGGKEGLGPAQPSHPGVAPDASLIFVNLKNEDGFLGNSRHLLEAVDYIFTRAAELGMPAVVNLSLSTSGGPHDGTTLVEQGFEELLKEPGRAIVISAGNAYAKQAHTAGTVKKDSPWTIRWYTDPRALKNEAEVWYLGSQQLEVTLVSPEGQRLGPVVLGETKDIYSGETRLGRISHRHNDPNNGDNQIDVRVPQVEGTNQAWQIELTSVDGDVPVEAWIEQDESGIARFGNPTKTAGTLGSICCGQCPLTVGAYDTTDHAYLAPLYDATAEGRTRNEKQKPEVSAPGVNIVAARAHGGVTIMSGTSMAAAHVTGLVALLFELALRTGAGFLPIEVTRKLIIEAAKENSKSSLGGKWDPRFGFGRVDGVETLKGFLTAGVQPPAPSPSISAAAVPESVVPPSNGTNGDSAEAYLKLLIAELQASSFHLTVESKPN
jgi:subtilisin family serine protease